MVFNMSDEAVILIADALHAYANVEAKDTYKNLTPEETSLLLDLTDTFDDEAMHIQDQREDRESRLAFSDDGTDYPDEPALSL